jgi:hypothetical protein
MLAVVPVVEHTQERLHQVCHFLGYFSLSVYLRVEIEEVDNHALDGIEQQVAVEMMVLLLQAHADILKILAAPFGLGVVEWHERVMEQHQSTPHTVIAQRRRQFGKLPYYIDYNRMEIIRLGNEFGALGLYEDEAVIRMDSKVVFVETDDGGAVGTQTMNEITFQGVHRAVVKRVFDNYILHNVLKISYPYGTIIFQILLQRYKK